MCHKREPKEKKKKKKSLVEVILWIRTIIQDCGLRSEETQMLPAVAWTVVSSVSTCLNPLILSVNTFRAHVGPLPFRQTEVGVVERLKGCVENHWVGLWTLHTHTHTHRHAHMAEAPAARQPSTSKYSQNHLLFVCVCVRVHVCVIVSVTEIVWLRFFYYYYLQLPLIIKLKRKSIDEVSGCSLHTSTQEN